MSTATIKSSNTTVTSSADYQPHRHYQNDLYPYTSQQHHTPKYHHYYPDQYRSQTTLLGGSNLKSAGSPTSMFNYMFFAARRSLLPNKFPRRMIAKLLQVSWIFLFLDKV